MPTLNRIDLRCWLDDRNIIREAESPSGICGGPESVGTDFLAAITDLSLRELYRMILARVRETGQSLTFHLRCDTAELRRLSFVRISRVRRDGSDGVEVLNGTLDERPHAQRLALLDPAGPHRPEFLTICSWCKQVKLADGRWVEVEEAMRVLQLFQQAALPGLSHGLCAVCAEQVRADFARQIAAPQD